MSRINTNIQSMIAQRSLSQNNNALTKTIERLGTGFRINRGSDDPAGLIASEKLRREKVAIEAAIGNAERADQIVNIAEGGITEINNMLVELQSLVVQTANEGGLSEEEKEANQLQIDAILQTVDRIASTTSFEGTKLLNGGYDFNVAKVSAVATDYEINGAKIAANQTVDVEVIVTQSARHGGAYLSTGGDVLLDDDASSRLTLEIAGANGTREFNFASGTTAADMAASINGFTSVTGVSAATHDTGVILHSTDFGSNEFVSVTVKSAPGLAGNTGVYALSAGTDLDVDTTGTTFAAATGPIRYEGQDVGAIINGVTARGKGRVASVNTDSLDLSITLSTNSAGRGAQVLDSFTAFTITGGGAAFSLGPTVDLGNQVRLGIRNVAARSLGDNSAGFLDELGSGQAANVVNGDMIKAQNIVGKAIDQVSALRGRLGAFQKNVVQSTIRALNVSYENTAAAESSIRDTDFAKETAALTRNQILVQAAMASLSTANSNPSNVLRLLG
jgi:flagellin